MGDLFSDYELLARSGAFDAQFYLAAYPEVASLNVDPLLHYMDVGARAGFSPSTEFDVAFYLEQCRTRGEHPDNPLLHYLTVGLGMGLRTRADAPVPVPSPPVSSERVIYLESPVVQNGAVKTPISGSMVITGWALIPPGVASIAISLDGKAVAVAQHGMRRDDVAAVFPSRADALMSGFATLVPHALLPTGRHTIGISLRDNLGNVEQVSFLVDVEDIPEGQGNWTLRKKVGLAELQHQLSALARLRTVPSFQVVLPLSPSAAELPAIGLTLRSLRDQVYPHWQLKILTKPGKAVASQLRKFVSREIPDLDDRIEWIVSGRRDEGFVAARKHVRGATRRPQSVVPLSAGDVLGCDALLELALALACNPSADFVYSDEQCISPVTKRMDVSFKPKWSPDLLLSGNYIGRVWCADVDVFARAGVSLQNWNELSEFDLVLRLTEAARCIDHVAKVLCKRTSKVLETVKSERSALASAIRRRGFEAEIEKGCAPHLYRVKRTRLTQGLVSIIIPTCASRGLIKVCIESLRKKTTYRNYEIICIENIPPEQNEWKPWVRSNADKVLSSAEPFNWSRYNNLAAEQASGEFLLFLNDDVEVLHGDWLDAMLEHAQRPEVGVVGARLLYANRSVQHVGLVLTETVGRARHLFRHAQEDDPGYFGWALTQRNVIAVTGACLLTRTEVFNALGRFDEAHQIVNNDLDFCLKSWSSGLLNVITPYATLVHHELASRGGMGDVCDAIGFDSRWRETFLLGDPYLNPNLSRQTDGVVPELESVRAVFPSRPLFSRDSIRNILVVKLDHLGDCITSLPALRKLKNYFPKATITVLSSSATQAIWRAEPVVDRVETFDFFHVRSGDGRKQVSKKQLAALGQLLGQDYFDIAIDLRKSPDSRYVLEYCNARFSAGFDQAQQFPWLDISLEWEGDRKFSAKRQNVGDDLINLVDAVAACCAMEPQPRGLAKRARLTLPPAKQRQLFSKPVVCIHVASGNELRQWPPVRFAELIDLLLSHYAVHILFIGSPVEASIVEQVIGQVRQPEFLVNLVGRVPLSELPALLERCALFVGNNSGPHHLAASLGAPTIGIHSGVVDAREWGPIGPNAVAIQRKMSCSPCYLERINDCPRDVACLKGLSSGEVFQACKRLLGADPKC